jgi:hypothetical protein
MIDYMGFLRKSFIERLNDKNKSLAHIAPILTFD